MLIDLYDNLQRTKKTYYLRLIEIFKISSLTNPVAALYEPPMMEVTVSA